jgi:hypothetical protein
MEMLACGVVVVVVVVVEGRLRSRIGASARYLKATSECSGNAAQGS